MTVQQPATSKQPLPRNGVSRSHDSCVPAIRQHLKDPLGKETRDVYHCAKARSRPKEKDGRLGLSTNR